MRLVLLIPMLAAALQADPITVIETKSGVGITSLFYSYSVPTSPGPVTAQINGYASCYNVINNCGNQPMSATIDLTMNLYTAGPIRDGIAFVQLYLSQSGGVIPDVSGAIGPYALGGCPSELVCGLSGRYFPFQLGIPFTIDLSGIANGSPPNNGAQFVASASLQLYELPSADGGTAGAPVQINLIPESGSDGLTFTGLSALALFAVRRSRNLPLL